MVQAACRAQCLVLAQVFCGDVGEGAGHVLDEVAEGGLVIVADDEDFLDLRYFGDSVEAVFYDRVAGDLEERLGSTYVSCVLSSIEDVGMRYLWLIERQWSKSSSA